MQFAVDRAQGLPAPKHKEMIMFKKMLTGAALALGAMTAQADVVTIGNVLNFEWEFDTGAGVLIEGTGSMTTSLVNTDDLQLVITLDNDTQLVSGNMALTSFGFGIDPNATGVIVADDGTLDWAAVLSSTGNTKIPSLQGIEICSFTGNNCSGGAQPDGLQAGGSDTFTLVLAGDFNNSSTVNIEPIGFKFQGTVGSFEFTTTDREPPEQAPAPATLLLLGLGLVGLAITQRRRRRV
jgi:hypothetical protein